MPAFVCQLPDIAALPPAEKSRLLAALQTADDATEFDVWLEDGRFIRFAAPMTWEDCLGGVYEEPGLKAGEIRRAAQERQHPLVL
jgi:hypothetical protein